MSASPTEVYVAWDPSLTEFNFGPMHPIHPVRLDLTAKLSTGLGLFDLPHVHVNPVSELDEAALARAHAKEYVDAVRAAETQKRVPASVTAKFGIGTDDVPRFDRIHSASGRLFQASLDCAREIIEGRYLRAVNFAGGMHHAMPTNASGFCVYNDVAGAIQEFLAAGYTRIAYIDLDAHHGDGTEAFFWDDERVLTLSIHENGRFLFPGTGFANDIGGLHAPGSAINIALPPRTGDADWLRAFDAVATPVIEQFDPQVIVSQHGCDGHLGDPLTHLRLSIDAMRLAATWIRDMADRHAGGAWLATGGGGYSLVDVVPRAWTNVVAVAAEAELPLDSATPTAWQDYVETITGRDAPPSMTDGHDCVFTPWSKGYNPDDDLDRTVMTTRRNVFPFHGLDPYYD